MSRLRHIILCAFILALLTPVSTAQGLRGVSKADAMEVVQYLRDSLHLEVYAVPDTTDKASYTIRGEGQAFIDEVFAQLREHRYSVNMMDGRYFIYRGQDMVTDLPAGYFAPQAAPAEKIAMEEETVVTGFENKIYEIGEPTARRSGKATVRGIVRDASTGEALAGVAVYDEKGAFAQTDAFGAYKIILPIGDNILKFSGFSMEDKQYHLRVYDDGAIDVMMKEQVVALAGAVVTAESMRQHRSTRMGIETVRISAIKNVPVTFGESDALKVVMTLPGVKSVGEISSGFNVRGGSTDQNLILFNNGTIYNPTHMFGLLSAFNSDVISDVELYKSSVPVEYGGRISSVLEVRSRDGNSKKVTGSLGLGLLTSRAHLEGPLGSENTTFILGARTTYSDWMLSLLPKNSAYSDGNAHFHDINAGISQRIGRNHSLHAYAYYSYDRFAFSGDTTYRYADLNVSLKWRAQFSDRTSAVTVAGYDDYDYQTEESGNAASAFTLASGIRQFFARTTFKTLLSDRHTITYGAGTVRYDLQPGACTPFGDSSLVAPRFLTRERAWESAAYFSDEWKATDALSLEAGIRYSNYISLTGGRKMYHAPEFRLSGKYSLGETTTIKAGFNTMHQYIHKISNSINISPNDTWKLSDASVRPQSGWQAAAGWYSTVAGGQVDLSAEIYYKHVRDFVDFRSGAVLEMNDNLAAELVPTYGRSYGIELMARKNLGQLNGWVSYTYSRAMQREMEDRGVETINGGRWYNASYDKPHDFKLVANYKFTHRYSVSANLDYSTGRPVTIPVGKYYYGGSYRLLYSDRNSYRIPDYFRLDLAMIIEPGHNLKQFAHMSVTFGVYNVTGRRNAYSVFYRTEGDTVQSYMMSVFATPIPYINLNLKLR